MFDIVPTEGVEEDIKPGTVLEGILDPVETLTTENAITTAKYVLSQIKSTTGPSTEGVTATEIVPESEKPVSRAFQIFNPHIKS